MFLLDTNIVAELRKPKPHAGLLAWYGPLNPDDIAVPSVVLGEVSLGVERLRSRDLRRANELEIWLAKIGLDFPMLPASAPIFRIWGKLMANSQPHLSNDALIAATALHHDLTVVTRNVRDFTAFGVLVANPFARQR